jgi:hypothetical protein
MHRLNATEKSQRAVIVSNITWNVDTKSPHHLKDTRKDEQMQSFKPD